MKPLKSTEDILIVDDNPENLRLLEEILKGEGFTVRVATNGESALQAVNAEVPDLILLDIQMPRMDGYEVCRRMKKNPFTKRYPCYFS